MGVARTADPKAARARGWSRMTIATCTRSAERNPLAAAHRCVLAGHPASVTLAGDLSSKIPGAGPQRSVRENLPRAAARPARGKLYLIECFYATVVGAKRGALGGPDHA